MRENFRSRPEGVQGYVERKRAEIEQKALNKTEKTVGFGPQPSPQNKCLIKAAVCFILKPLFVRFHQKMPSPASGILRGNRRLTSESCTKYSE